MGDQQANRSSQTNSGRSGDAFPSEDQQKKAAENTDMHYNAAYDENSDDNYTENGAVAQNMGRRAMGEAPSDSSHATGRGFTTSSNNPGPGTATDRGYGRTGSPEYGVGIDAPGLGNDREAIANSNNATPGDDQVGVGASQDAKNLRDTRSKDWGLGKDNSISGRNQPDDTSLGGGAADDDTSAGYGLGESTGNSSDSDTGLGLGATSDPRGGNS